MQLKIAIKISLAFLLGLSILYVYYNFLPALVYVLTLYPYSAMIATLVKTIVIADVYKSPDVTGKTICSVRAHSIIV